LSYVKNTGHLSFYRLDSFLIIFMKKQIKKDKNIRRLFAQQELDNIILKSIIKNENLSLIVK